MAKEKTDRELINVILTKIKNVFKTDIGIINYKYVVGGPESEAANPGKYLVILEPEWTELLRRLIPDNNFIYINNIINAKKEDDYCAKECPFNYRHDMQTMMESLLEAQKGGEFQRFELNEDQLKYFFNNQLTITFKKKTDNLADININKTMFPMLTEKTLGNLSYYVKEKDELLTDMITQYISEWFIIVSKFEYICLDIYIT